MKRHNRAYIRKSNRFSRFGRRLETFGKEAIANLFALLLRTNHRANPLDVEQVRSVLILRYDGIGDMVLTTPIWRILKRLNPAIRIGVAGSYRNLDVITADSDVDIRYDFSENSLRALVRGIRQARNEPWDLVFHCVYKNKTKGAIVARLCAKRGTTSILARDHIKHYQKLFSIVAYVPYGDVLTPMLDQLKGHFAQTISVTPTEQEWHPSIRIDPRVEQATRLRIDEALLTVGSSAFVHLNTESALTWKEWGMENSFALSKKLTEHFPSLSVFWTGSGEVAKTIEKFLLDRSTERSNGFRIRLFPTNSLQELLTVVRNAALVITPDTSLIHLATAELKPTIGLYPELTEWMPYNVPNEVLYPKPGKPVSTISIEAAFEAAIRLLPKSL